MGMVYKAEVREDLKVEGEIEALRSAERAFHEERDMYKRDHCKTVFFARGKRILSA